MVGLGSIIVQLKTTSVGRRGCHLPSHLCTAKARQRQAFKRKVIPIPHNITKPEALWPKRSTNQGTILQSFVIFSQLPKISPAAHDLIHRHSNPQITKWVFPQNPFPSCSCLWFSSPILSSPHLLNLPLITPPWCTRVVQSRHCQIQTRDKPSQPFLGL